MNTRKLTELADHLEKTKPPHFDMNLYNHYCGTPACIAGHAVAYFTKTDKIYQPVFYRAKEILELTDAQASALFEPDCMGYCGLSDAIAALRALADYTDMYEDTGADEIEPYIWEEATEEYLADQLDDDEEDE